MATEAEIQAQLADPNLDPATELELRRALKAAKSAPLSEVEAVKAKYQPPDTGMPGGGDTPPESVEDRPSGAAQLGYSMARGFRGVAEFPTVIGLNPVGDVSGARENERLYEESQGLDSITGRSKTLRETIGDFIPAAVVPANLGRGLGTRLLSTLAFGAAAGGAMPADSVEERKTNAEMGAAIGAGFQLVPEAALGAKNFVFSRERKALDMNAYKEGLRLEQRTGIPLSEGARSLDPTTLKLEAEAFGAAKEAFKQEEIPATRRYFNRIADKMDPATIPDAKLIQQMSDAFESHIDNLAGLRRTEWLESASKIRAEAGKKPLFYPDKLAAELQDLSEETLKIAPKISDAEAAAFGKTLQKVMDKGGVDIDDVDRLLQAFTADSASTGYVMRDLKPDMARVFSNRLKTALKEDIETAIKADPNNKALGMLNDARATYAKNSAPIDELRGTALDKWFGKDNHIAPETVLDRLTKLPPSEVETATRLMDKIDPSIMEKARGKVIRQAIDKAYDAKRTATDPAYRLTELAGALEKDQAHFRAVFPDPTTRAEIMDGIDTVRRLAASDAQRAGQSRASEIRNVGMGAAYLNPVSASTRIASVFTPSMLEKLFFTPEGRKIVTELSVPNPSWQRRAATGAALLRIYSENK